MEDRIKGPNSEISHILKVYTIFFHHISMDLFSMIDNGEAFRL